MFMSTYGTPNISVLANYTTPYFRNYKPKELWIIETWELLQGIGYRHLSGEVLDQRMSDDRAVVITSSSILTHAGETVQKEIFSLINTPEGWKLNDITIENEQIEKEHYSL